MPTATAFQLQFALNSLSAPWKTASASIPGAQQRHTLEGLEPGTEYIARVRAAHFREAVWGGFSASSRPMRTQAAPQLTPVEQARDRKSVV